MNIPTEHSQKQGNDDVTEAAKELLHLHSCEQEGLQSGKPTPKMWFDAVNKLSDAIEKYSIPPKPVDDGQEGRGLGWVKASERLPENLVAYKPIRIVHSGLQFYGLGNLQSFHNGPAYYDIVSDNHYSFDNVEWLDESAALPVGDGEGEVDWIKNANEMQPLTSVVTGGVKEDAVGFAEWLTTMRVDRIGGGFWEVDGLEKISDDGKTGIAPVMSTERLYQLFKSGYKSEGQPAQE